MGQLKITWKRRALLRVSEISTWYFDTMGVTAADHFLQGVNETVHVLSKNPQIGVIDKRRSTSMIKYYSFVSHPKYKIVYYFNSRTIYIVTIYRTLMKNG